jgi:hypothetical protein
VRVKEDGEIDGGTEWVRLRQRRGRETFYLRQIFVIRANSIKTSKSKEKLLPHKTNFTSITRKEQLKQFIKRERNIRCNEIDFLYIGAYTHKISPQPHYSH